MHGCESPSPSLVVDPLGGSMPLHRQLYQKLGPAQAGPPSRSVIERLRERVGFGDEVSRTSGRHVPSVSPRPGGATPMGSGSQASRLAKTRPSLQRLPLHLHATRSPTRGCPPCEDPFRAVPHRLLDPHRSCGRRDGEGADGGPELGEDQFGGRGDLEFFFCFTTYIVVKQNLDPRGWGQSRPAASARAAR
jgi:hypothetical protein